MSMHSVEAFVEEAITTIAQSALPTRHKRNLIHSLFDMQNCCDCSFTNLRTIEETIACSYSFVFDPTDMPDYEERKDFYDNLGADYGYGHGDVYLYNEFDGCNPALVGKACVDSGSATWQHMIRAGRITGDGACPVEILDPLDVIKEVAPMIKKTGEAFTDAYFQEGLSMLAMMSGALDDASDEDIFAITGITSEDLEEVE